MSDRRLTKLKYKPDEGITIMYEQMNASSGVYDKITLESYEEPRNSLKTALQKMKDHLVEICEIPSSYIIEIRSVSIPYSGEDEIQGLVITGLRELSGSNSPLVINSPCFFREPFSDGQDKNVFSSRCANDLDQLVNQVFAYVDGERAQKELEFPKAESPEPVPAAR